MPYTVGIRLCMGLSKPSGNHETPRFGAIRGGPAVGQTGKPQRPRANVDVHYGTHLF